MTDRFEDLELDDPAVWTDDELLELSQVAHAIREKRIKVKRAEDEVLDLVQAWQEDQGRIPGEPWVQPTGYLDAYLEGAEVTHIGKEWESNLDGNVWEPGDRGWREKAGEGDPVPDFVQPSGYEDAYNIGDQVTWTDGNVYASNIDGNVWSPAAAPNRWDLVDS